MNTTETALPTKRGRGRPRKTSPKLKFLTTVRGALADELRADASALDMSPGEYLVLQWQSMRALMPTRPV
jgi:hypothetical protein